LTGDGQPLSEELPQNYNTQNQHEAESDGSVVGLGVYATRTAVFINSATKNRNLP